MESGWRKETAVPWASDWTYLDTWVGGTWEARRAAGGARRGKGRGERMSTSEWVGLWCEWVGQSEWADGDAALTGQ